MFGRFAHAVARASGKSLTFAASVAVIFVWAVCGPIFHYSDTWQLIINTGTTVVTFLQVFLIQNTQNRDSAAIHAKLDTLIAAVERADNRLIRGEELSEEMVETLRGE